MAFKKGDVVTPKAKSVQLNDKAFWWRNLPVRRVEPVNLEYAGNQFVYILINNKEQGFYASALEHATK